jgi:hypothetical protein
VASGLLAARQSVQAGQIETLPSQQSLPPLPAPRPPLVHQHQNQNQEETIPPTLPGVQGPTREIPLPEVFRGCWQGSVPQVDSIVPLDPMSMIFFIE